MRNTEYIKRKQRLFALRPLLLVLALLVMVGGGLFIQHKPSLAWRYEVADTWIRGMINPIEAMPTASHDATAEPFAGEIHVTPTPPMPTPTSQPVTPTEVPVESPTPTPTPTPLPATVMLKPPEWEKQEMNNCGPATLTMLLRYYNWKGDQKTIAKLVKPIDQDRNVNVDELIMASRNLAGYLNIQFRVGGDNEMLKKFLAAGYPVMIEEGFKMNESYWAGDDRWSGHYLLITGYDDTKKIFVAQDSFVGTNQIYEYDKLGNTWQFFNHVYIVAYPPGDEEKIKEIMGPNWSEDENRKLALESSQQATIDDPTNPFAWYNYGANLTYFESYGQAAVAFDEARALKLPQRTLRYQFHPFFAYFYTNRIDDLMELTAYALKITPNAEEALLWRGWGNYRLGKRDAAMRDFQAALAARPGYTDAQYAIKFLQEN